MYATCLFCSGALGRNEILEHFPVGRRLAFDAAKGRLWVVCPSCRRWNLTPLEIRWEAIEEAERHYRDTRLRTATEHVGLAKLGDGTELVRIGRPLLPEFAAWRYGDVFRRRWRQAAVVGAAGFVVPLAYAGAQIAGVAGALSTAYMAYSTGRSLTLLWQARRTRAMVTAADGRRLLITGRDAASTRIVRRGDRWELELEHRRVVPTGMMLRALGVPLRRREGARATSLSGDAALRALSAVLPIVNHGGATAKMTASAVSFAAESRTVTEMLKTSRAFWTDHGNLRQLGLMPTPLRLGLEMVAHEDDERRALEGELRELEARWREAEEIAAIADRLFLPNDIAARLSRLERSNAP